MFKKLLTLFLLAISFGINLAAQSSHILYDFIYEDVHYKKVSDFEVEISPVSVTFTAAGEEYEPTNGNASDLIPSSVSDTNGNWYQVVGIGAHAFEGSRSVYRLFVNGQLNANLRYIGDCAFQNCSGMVIAEIPNTVTTVGKNAFKGCAKLKYLALGVTGSLGSFDKTMEIKEGAFCDTPELASVFIGSMQFSLPQTNAFASDSYISVHQTFFVSDPNDYRYNCFRDYDCARYGSLKNYTTQYNGLAPGFIPEFTSNLPQEISFSVGNMDQIQDVNAGSGTVGCGVTFKLPYPYSLQFGIRMSCNYTITKAPLSLNVKNCSRIYGEDNPEFEIEVEGYVNGEGEEIFSTPPKIVNGIADWAPALPSPTSPVGEYELVAMADFKYPQNYEISGSSRGIITITPAPLEISAPSLTREYGQPNPEIELVYNGFKNNETEEVLSDKPSISLDASTDSPVGEYPIIVSGAEAKNYDISYNPGKLIITKANQSLTWNQTFDNVKIGDEIQLTAVSSSGLPIEYVSSNPDIILINGGYAEFIADGKAEITAKQTGNDNYLEAPSISKEIDVLPVEINEIIIDAEQITLSVGDSYQLTATINPDNATYPELLWRSENENIATVNDAGLVRAVGKGTTTIIVESVNNPNIKAECTVDVSINSGIEGVSSDGDIRIVVENKCLHIYNAPDNAVVNVYSSHGVLIYSGTETHIPLSSGLYIVKVGNSINKIAM